MKTAAILKQLESAKDEAEMLAIASKLGVARAFFNAGSADETPAKPAAKGLKVKRAAMARAQAQRVLARSKRKIKARKSGVRVLTEK